MFLFNENLFGIQRSHFPIGKNQVINCSPTEVVRSQCSSDNYFSICRQESSPFEILAISCSPPPSSLQELNLKIFPMHRTFFCHVLLFNIVCTCTHSNFTISWPPLLLCLSQMRGNLHGPRGRWVSPGKAVLDHIPQAQGHGNKAVLRNTTCLLS